jgi:hypothetical protein
MMSDLWPDSLKVIGKKWYKRASSDVMHNLHPNVTHSVSALPGTMTLGTVHCTWLPNHLLAFS